ncbi:MAG TPA: TcmI family type II polyketide cyclase [Amycolatopsis sp.]|uniref:TcmI family type II polyketide cyclase n=1 Tax=Amycolatopsis sp. TaxID=37632 RepID=UPI002B46EC08|nr:TcmI family type II polyketide cyclase [Amycolatopsis sp.]HKS47187.1 TcmI family type II polyketide cyclase [Amycolatopsis sp.]
MHSTLIQERLKPDSSEKVAVLFGAFDESEMPYRMGTRRRQLFHYKWPLFPPPRLHRGQRRRSHRAGAHRPQVHQDQ